MFPPGYKLRGKLINVFPEVYLVEFPGKRPIIVPQEDCNEI